MTNDEIIARLDETLADLEDARAHYRLTTVGYKSNPKPGGCKHAWTIPPAGTEWSNGDLSFDASTIKLEELKAALAPTPPPPTWPITSGDGLFGFFALPAPAGLDLTSLALIATLTNATTGWQADIGGYGVAIYPVDNATPLRTITIDTYPFNGQANPIRVPIPNGAWPAAGSDGHAAFLHPNGCMWELWSWDGSTTCGAANSAKWNTTACGYPAACGCRGSSFYLTAGLVWPAEIARGHIDHALALILPQAAVRKAFVAPSTDSDGTLPTGIPEGARLVLDPTLDVSAWPTFERVVAKAFQTYGGFLVDKTGSDANVICVDPRSWTALGHPDPWAPLGLTGYPQLPNLYMNRHRIGVAPLGTITTTWTRTFHPSGCER